MMLRNLLDWQKVWNDKSKNHQCAMTGGRKKTSLLDAINTQVLDAMHFNADDIVLDLGCGAGNLVQEISLIAKKVVGIDLSLGMLQYAEKKSNTFYVQSDMQFLPFKNKTFSKIISVSSLMYLAEYSLENLFRQLDKVLMPEGIIFFGQLINQDRAKSLFSFKGFNKPEDFSELAEIIKKKAALKLGVLTTHNPSVFSALAHKYGYRTERLPGISPQTIYRDNYLHFSMTLTKR